MALNLDIMGLYSDPLLVQLKWHDSYDGHGEHYYDYNHGDSYKAPEPAYAPAPSYQGSEVDETYVAAPEAAFARQRRSLNIRNVRNTRSLPVFYYL